MLSTCTVPVLVQDVTHLGSAWVADSKPYSGSAARSQVELILGQLGLWELLGVSRRTLTNRKPLAVSWHDTQHLSPLHHHVWHRDSLSRPVLLSTCRSCWPGLFIRLPGVGAVPTGATRTIKKNPRERGKLTEGFRNCH